MNISLMWPKSMYGGRPPDCFWRIKKKIKRNIKKQMVVSLQQRFCHEGMQYHFVSLLTVPMRDFYQKSRLTRWSDLYIHMLSVITHLSFCFISSVVKQITRTEIAASMVKYDPCVL